MQAVVDKMMQLAQIANGKRFFQTQAELLRLHQELRDSNIDAPNAEPVFMAALKDVALELNKPNAKDETLKAYVNNMQTQLRYSLQMINRLTRLSQERRLSQEQQARFEELYLREYNRIVELARTQRALKLSELQAFNRNLMQMMQELYGVQPELNPNQPVQSQPATGFRGWAGRMLDSLVNGLRTMGTSSSPEEKKSAISGMISTFVGFFLQLIGNFFKTFLGAGASSKVDELMQAAEPLVGNMINGITEGIDQDQRHEERQQQRQQRRGTQSDSRDPLMFSQNGQRVSRSMPTTPRPQPQQDRGTELDVVSSLIQDMMRGTTQPRNSLRNSH